jgi:hypothetical protein
MLTALLANAAAVTLLMQPGTGNTQTAARDPLEGGWFGRSANWVEDAGNNFLYHNEGSSARKFILNANSTVGGSNAYLTVNANTSGFFGMVVHSPDDTAIPYYGYVLNSNLNGHLANHSYNPNTSSWTLSIEGAQSLIVDSNRDLLMPAGGVVADFYELNTPRSEFVSVNRYDGGINFTNGELLRSVDLPEGSQITSFSARVVDQSPANVTVSLVRFDLNANSYTVIAFVTSSGSSSSPAPYSTSTINSSVNIVDNENYTYHAYYQPTPLDQFGNPTSEFRSAKIEVLVNEL